MYVNEIDSPGRRSRPKIGIGKDRVREYMHEKGADRSGGLKSKKGVCG